MNDLVTQREQFMARQSRTISVGLDRPCLASDGVPATVIICRKAGGVGVDTLAAALAMSHPNLLLVQVGGGKGPAFHSHDPELRQHLQILSLQPAAVVNARFLQPELPAVIMVDQNLLKLVPLLKGMLDATPFGEHSMIWYVLDEHEKDPPFVSTCAQAGFPAPKLFCRPKDWYADRSETVVTLPWLPPGLQEGFYQRHLPLRTAAEKAQPGDAAQFVMAAHEFLDELARK